MASHPSRSVVNKSPTKQTYVFSKADRFGNPNKGQNTVGSYDIKSQFSQASLKNINKGFGSESKRFSFLGVGKGPMPN